MRAREYIQTSCLHASIHKKLTQLRIFIFLNSTSSMSFFLRIIQVMSKMKKIFLHFIYILIHLIIEIIIIENY